MKNKQIEPVWIDSEEWEDLQRGMYDNGNNIETIKKCKEILTSNDLYKQMTRATMFFPKSTLVNFTNRMFNPVSWLGQATCNMIANAKAQETCRAWMMMTKEEQEKANYIAKQVIKEWRANYENIQSKECLRS